MNTFRLVILTPDKKLFDGQIVQLTARTTEGDVGILARHIRYVAILKTGALTVKLENGDIKKAAIAGGVLKVSDDKTSVLVTAGEWAEEIDPDWAERSRQDAMAKIEAFQNEPDRLERANLKLQRALNRLQVSGRSVQNLPPVKKKK
ncbi:MAG: ATP synthase F1 subunit epsilon [Oscillospiraceae bacterium]|nr:ATP synthase F1 subunit epsilon [Oscillospiraceae bacterium]